MAGGFILGKFSKKFEICRFMLYKMLLNAIKKYY